MSKSTIIPHTATQLIATEEPSSTLLHRLHTNERQLRTLAVILSLTGGLALSFALGVGILIYWYSRKCKQKRQQQKSYPSLEHNSTIFDHHHHSQEEEEGEEDEGDEERRSGAIVEVDNLPSSNDPGPSSSSCEPIPFLIPPPISTIQIPEPSAPTAKELHMCDDCMVPPPAYSED